MKYILMFFFFSCLYSDFDFERESSKILTQFLKEARQKKIYASGLGGSSGDEIIKINLSLDCYQNLNLSEVRELYLELLNRVINLYNSNEKLRPYLHNFPFNQDNIKLMISFQKTPSKLVPKEYIALVFMAKGKILYKAFDHDEDQFILVFSEDAKKALSQYCKELLQRPKNL